MTPPRSDFYVYVLFRDDGTPFYVGKGRGRRLEHHEICARAGRLGHRFNIIRDMQSRGIEVPKLKLHERLTSSIANEYEIALIAAIGRMPFGPLVNLTNGGEGTPGWKHTLVARARMSAVVRAAMTPDRRKKCSAARRGKEQPPKAVAITAAKNRGRKMPPEAIAKTAAANLGRKHTREARAKMSASQKGRKRSAATRAKIAAGHRGIKFSLEHRARIAAALLGKKKTLSPAGRAKIAAANRRRTKSKTTPSITLTSSSHAI